MRSFVVQLIIIYTLTVALIVAYVKHSRQQVVAPAPVRTPAAAPQPLPPPPPKAEKPKVSQALPPYLSYSGIVSQFNTWNREAKDWTEVGTYGKTTRGVEIVYLRINNKVEPMQRPKVLLTAAIHGDEQMGTCMVMGVAGTLLSKYGEDSKVTELMDSRDIYIVPSVSPDSYSRGRIVDGVDPNRNFDNNSIAPIAEIKNFFLKERFTAVLSGHTFGRVCMYPWGATYEAAPDKALLKNLCEEMAQLAGYNCKQLCYAYPHTIHGTEGDWYYRNGAISAVIEIGTHQNAPSPTEIQSEFPRIWPAYLYFIEHAPKRTMYLRCQQ